MVEPLTNVIIASILHLIQRDLAENGRAPPHSAPLRWAPPRQAPTTSVAPTPPQERTKGDGTAPSVPAHGAITTKSTRAVATRATAATVRCALHQKITSRPWAAGGATGGRHYFHDGRTKKNPCNRRTRKGVTSGGAPDKGHS
jgi:transposase InsO family protein